MLFVFTFYDLFFFLAMLKLCISKENVSADIRNILQLICMQEKQTEETLSEAVSGGKCQLKELQKKLRKSIVFRK